MVAAVIYPFVTVLAIIVTGNHYVVDALGALPIVGIGYVVARRFTRAGRAPAAPADSAGADQPAALGSRSSAAAGSA